jgi:broad specificity phosphatase PhoE
MPEIMLVRHAQASFGKSDYDVLSELGHQQAFALGQSLAERATALPDKIYIGAQRRHRETLEGLAAGFCLDPSSAIVHEGLNEFNAGELIAARYGSDDLPADVRGDRRLYFRALRDVVLAWQRDEIDNPPESWRDFSSRVLRARDAMIAEKGRVLAVSSGGAISRMIVSVLDAPAPQMISLQLQMRNCAVSTLVGSANGMFLHAFNEVPYLRSQADERLMTYA